MRTSAARIVSDAASLNAGRQAVVHRRWADEEVTSLDQFRWRTFVWALSTTLGVLIPFWIVVPPTYLTNDDTTIRKTLEGLTAPGAAPSGYLPMAHSLLGWGIVALQRVVHVHLWDFVVAGLLVCAIATLLAYVWCLSRSTLERVFGVTTVLVTIAPLVAGMQFTISATLAGIAAMTIAATELLQPAPRRSLLAASAALLTAGLLVRPMGAAAGGLLVVGLLLPFAIADREDRQVRIYRLGIAALLLVVTVFGLSNLDDALYRLSPAWSAYRDDRWVLARFFEWGGDLPSASIDSLRSRLGWSANDWELLQRFWGVDAAVHSHTKVQALYGAWLSLSDWSVRAHSLVQRGATELSAATVLRLVSESVATLGACVLIALAYARRRALVPLCASAAIFFAACITIEVGFKELPTRLFAPLQVALAVASLITCRMLVRPTTRRVTAFAAVLAGALFVYQAQATITSAVADSRQSKEIDTQVLELLRQSPSLLVLHADSFPSEYWWRPFHTPPVQLAALQLGLNNHHPYVQRFVQNVYGGSLLHAICTDPSIIVVAEHGRLEPVTAFMKEHYDADVTWIPAYEGSFRAWRCSPNTGE